MKDQDEPVEHDVPPEALGSAEAANATLEMPPPSGPPPHRPAGETAAVGDAIRPGAVIAHRYKLLQQIGEGGFGSVYLAEQEHPVRRRVALKVIKLGMDTKQVIARFQAERQALAMLSHPNVAAVYDAGATETGRPYFVMEYVPGEPITAFCDRHNYTTRQRLELFTQACEAIQHAHQKAIIHRDVKPSNLLVMLKDDKPLVKVIDFGVAKATAHRLTEQTLFTEQGQLIGTPEYMSPEQAEMNALDVDTRTDIYSLGVVLYELLTGVVPFEAKMLRIGAFAELQRMIREVEPPKPSTRLSTMAAGTLAAVAARRRSDPGRLCRACRGELDSIVMKCLSKDRGQRYEAANALARDVQRLLADEPVEARPPTVWYRARKFLRRHRGPAAAAAALVLALLGGIAGTSWGLLKAGQRHAEADRSRQEEVWQRQRAEANADRARAEADAARKAEGDTAAFGHFLVHRLLAAARPQGVQMGLGVDVTVAHALEEAEKWIGDDFAGRPVAEARARHAIGVTWRTLSRFDAAERHLRRAVELREREHGPDDRDTLDSRNSFGSVLGQTGRFEEAIAYNTETLQRCTRSLGPHDPLTRTVAENVAYAHYKAGHVRQAITLYEQELEKRKATFGEDNLLTLETLSGLAGAYRAAGNHTRAELMLKETLARQQVALGPHDDATLKTMETLAAVYADTGKDGESLPLREELLKARQARFGADHKDTLVSMTNLGAEYAQLGRFDKAFPLLEPAAERLEAKFTPEHPDALVACNNLAFAYWKARKLERAAALFETLLQRAKARRPANHPLVVKTAFNLGVVYFDSNSFDKALPQFEHALAGRTAAFGPLDDRTTERSLPPRPHASRLGG